MKRAKKLLVVVLALALAATLLVACNNTDAPSVTQYTLKYSGGEGYTGTVPADAKAEAGSKVTLAGALQWEGHDFVAWTLDGNEYAAGAEFTMPEKDVTLVAKWEPKSDDPTKYTLSYAGGEIYKGTLPAAKQYAKGATVTLADALTESGYTFLKWTYKNNEYDAKATFTMPAENVVMTAKWTPEEEEETPPSAQELGDKFYTASNWEYMTNNNGESNDGGDIPYSLSDGSIKFHRLNQAVQIGNRDNGTFSFMLKATNDFHFWMNSTGKDNQGSNSYRLSYEYSGLRIEVDGGVAATVKTSTYKKAEWNRFDVVFKTADGKTTIALWVNGEKATLALGSAQNVALDEAGNVVHARPARFETGDWAVVKVWEANNYVQFKPVSKADEKDVPIVAAVGASITEGAGAGNFYTESYPAQLQKALGGAYNVVNLGKSGRTVRTDTGVESDNTPVPWLENVQFDGFKALKPDIVIINMGTNDSKTSLNPVSTLETFKAAYEHLIDELLKVNPEMRVIACTVPTAYSDIYDINNDNIQNIIAPAIKAVAEEKELELVDLYEITKNKSLLFGDGVHPGTAGYGMFAEIFEKVIKGEELTKEFLDGINEKYNDPTYEIKDIHAALSTQDDKVMLTVTGNITIGEEYYEYLRLDLNTGKAEQESRSVPIQLGDNGDFSVSVQVDDLTGTDWYNVRIYYTEVANHLVLLEETDHKVNDVFVSSTRKVTVQSWTSGEDPVFSLKIEGYSANLAVTATDVKFEDGDLVFSGMAGADITSLVVYLYDSNEKKDDFNATAEIQADRSFTVRIGLDQLTASNGNWYFLMASVNGGEKAKINYANYSKDKYDYVGENHSRTYRFENNGALAVAYSDYTPPVPEGVKIELTELVFDGANLKVKGTVTGAEELEFLLFASEDDQTYAAKATLTEGTFEALVPLPPKEAKHNGSWYRLQVKADGEAASTLTWTEHGAKVSAARETTHINGGHNYKFIPAESTEDIAISYQDAPVEPTYSVTLTSAKIEVKEGKIELTIIGTTTDTAIRLYVGNAEATEEFYHDITLEEGAFTMTFDLATLATGTGWYNVRIYMSDGQYYAVSYEETKNGANETLKIDDAFIAGNRKVTIKSWDDKGVKTLSLAVEEYDDSYTITATSITFEEQYLVVTGTATGNVQSLVLALHNDNNMQDDIRETATVTENAFTVKIDLTKITLGANSWLYLWYSVNGGADAKVQYEKNDTKHVYGNREYRFENWEGIAIAYSDYTPPVPEDVKIQLTEMAFEGANLKVKGTVTGATALKFSLYASEDSEKYEANATITEGSFEASIALPPSADAHKGSWYRLRVKTVEDEAVGYTNLTWDGNAAEIKAEAKAQTHVNGAYSYKFEDTGDIAVTYADYVAPPVEDKSVTVSSMRFADGKFIVEGTVGASIAKIIFHLHNTTNPAFDLSKQATLEGQNFKVEFPLGEIKREDGSDAPKEYINVRYEINEDGFKTPLNLLPANNGGYAVGQEYRYSDRTWTLKADNSRTYLNWSKHTESYTITKCEITDKEGVATLTIEGTYTGDVDYSNLQLKLDKTSDTKDSILVDNTATEAGQFKFEVAINELLTSTKTENSKEEGYFLRLWNKEGNAKIADINSTWVSDKLFEKVEIGDSVYYFFRNNLGAYYTLGIVRFEKSTLEG